MTQSNFWIQLLQRLFKENPVFFKYIQWVSIAVMAVTGLPDFLAMFDIHITGAWLIFQNATLAKMALISAILSRLPNKEDNQVKTNSSGVDEPRPKNP